MERVTSILEAKEIMHNNFVGPEELALIADKMGITVPTKYPEIPFSPKELLEKHENYVLILGLTKMKDGSPLTIKTLRNHFGINPDKSEPCFYNQDWYMNESFIDESINADWFLIRKEVFDSSRAINPDLLSEKYHFPSAIQCVYFFFVMWYFCNEVIWEYDFVWCSDHDHNGDRIYVGKYKDIDGINKNGFSIHRQLSLRKCYAATELG